MCLDWRACECTLRGSRGGCLNVRASGVYAGANFGDENGASLGGDAGSGRVPERECSLPGCEVPGCRVLSAGNENARFLLWKAADGSLRG